jgi:hypothetical protein
VLTGTEIVLVNGVADSGITNGVGKSYVLQVVTEEYPIANDSLFTA